jgi:hypothetical protein
LKSKKLTANVFENPAPVTCSGLNRIGPHRPDGSNRSDVRSASHLPNQTQ